MGDNTNCPRIVIAGTQSGVGKTTISLALTSALKKRGLKVQTFKVGPDFLDPTYLSLASGKDCYNLDGWMSGRDYVTDLFSRTTASADTAVIEGVMGLFDGADSKTSEGSSAEIAIWLSAPVLLVINAKGIARSVAALVKGYCDFDPKLKIVGVIANNCGSERHRQWLEESLSSASLPPLLGAIPTGAFPELKRRHLGLVTADNEGLTQDKLNMLADSLEKHASIDDIIKYSKDTATISASGNFSSGRQVKKTVRIGIAYDNAFHFYYPDTLQSLESRGCELVKFSLLNDTALDDGLDALYIGGGYPEEYAEELSQNSGMLESVKKYALSGRPVYGECGGLIYLSEGVEKLDGKRYRLTGLLPSWTKMREKFKSLGYVEVDLKEDSLIGLRGQKLRGHRFHYSELMDDPTDDPKWRTVYTLKRRRSDDLISEGYSCKRILASYVHAHLASRPEAVDRFIDSSGGFE